MSCGHFKTVQQLNSRDNTAVLVDLAEWTQHTNSGAHSIKIECSRGPIIGPGKLCSGEGTIALIRDGRPNFTSQSPLLLRYGAMPMGLCVKVEVPPIDSGIVGDGAGTVTVTAVECDAIDDAEDMPVQFQYGTEPHPLVYTKGAYISLANIMDMPQI